MNLWRINSQQVLESTMIEMAIRLTTFEEDCATCKALGSAYGEDE